MVLLRPGASVIAVQLFWISIVLIGWTLTQLFVKRDKETAHRWLGLPFAMQFLIASATGFGLFSLFTVIAYCFALPIWTLTLFYLSFLVGSGVYLLQNRRSIVLSVRKLSSILRPQLFFSPLGVMTVIVLVDLGLMFFIGGFLGGDGFVHVSKIRHLLGHGFTLTDAYYGTVPETRHTVSVLHTLMAIPSSFGINPITSWYASGILFKLLKSIAVFSLAWQLFYWVKERLRLQYSALVVIISLAIYSNYFISYPSIFVTVWIILLIIGLFHMVQYRNISLLLLASLLIATTHPVASLAAVLLVGLVGVGLALFERTLLTKKIILGLTGSALLLLSTPLFTALLPNQMSDYTRNYGANGYSYYHIGGLRAFSPVAAEYFATDSFTATSWPIWALSLLGIGGLFVLVKDRRYRIVIGALILYVPLVLYNPVIFTALTKVLPVWGIARFTAVNQLTLVMAFFGLLMICTGIGKIVRLRPRISLLILTVASLTIFVRMQAFGAIDPKVDRTGSMYKQQKFVYDSLHDLAPVLPDDNNAIVLAEQSWDSFIIPVVAPLRVVAINEANSPPAADMKNRQACFSVLYNTLDPGTLKQARVSYVLVKRSNNALLGLALSNTQLTIQKQSSDYVLFKFNGAGVNTAGNPVCRYNE